MIGYVTAEIDSNPFTDCLMKFAYQYNVPFCVISLDVIKEHFFGSPLIARRWNGSFFEESQVSLPSCLDTGGKIFSTKHEALYPAGFLSWINNKCEILTQRSIAKGCLSSVMLSSNLARYAIPTWKVSSYSEVREHLIFAKHLLLKPLKGRKGLGICRITVEDDQSVYMTDTDGSYVFSEEAFEQFQEKTAAANLGKSFYLQPCLDISLDETHSVDFRLLRHRGLTGEWEEVASHAKIGANSLVSNVAQGGYIDKVENVLQTIAGSRSGSLYDEMMYIGMELPRLIQKYRGDAAYCLGIDVAVDRQTMHPYVLEANTYPGWQFHYYQLANKRVQFYQYLLNKTKTT